LRPVIILFSKAPVPGRVKTRLQPALSAEEAASLHTAFVWDMIELLQSLSAAVLELHTDIPTDAWADAGVAQRIQFEGGLQLKMLHSLEEALSSGHPRALVVGSDAPTLPVGHIAALLASQADVALGPTDDGGFYAISCGRTHPDMFRDVEWSCPSTLDQTVRAIQACGLTVEIGRRWFDVDEIEDVDRLVQSPDLPEHTKRWFENRKLLPS
jgi:rSAM/selenodomain-associated transferase 1